ncbi:hypothetical protein [Pelagicoccus sp. SDUM812003]|uniref:hypothetical protein n=1 Tax=Pelagicoccus sp. SDUM812003 TaxID=3041267 RepID=UPI00280D3C09|nr:hypothetical protein [Pelagicoccus sp. SDUM812003]MDQ8204319.1 hypothetical protein [Pelagicoccus sp. SDUM812003]
MVVNGLSLIAIGVMVGGQGLGDEAERFRIGAAATAENIEVERLGEVRNDQLLFEGFLGWSIV